jgi:small subunit ribosomal protein S6
MAFYESVFIVRQDVSFTDVDKIINDFSNIIKEQDGKIHKSEYWGLRSLAYEINNNKKGHYVLLGIETDYPAVKEMERKMRLSEDVIRFLTSRVDQISKEPSPILKSKNSESEDLIDVTLNKDLV